MTVGEVIVTELAAVSAVTNLVGGRVYPNLMPQGATLPALVYSVVSDVPEATFTGTLATDMVVSRVQIDCYAKKYLDAQAVADAVDAALSALSRPDLAGQRQNKRDLYDDETQLHRVSMDFLLQR